MSANKLKDFLNQENVKYVSIIHSPAYTAQEVAQSSHIPGGEIAKTVIVKIDGKLTMIVLPAPEHVDLELVEATTGASHVSIATEEEFGKRFPGCEIGAMPPFGNLYEMPVYVEEALTNDETIAFNACSHSELISISYKDFFRLVKPEIVRISTKYTQV